MYQTMLQPVLDLNPNFQVLLFNLPGQAYSEIGRHQVVTSQLVCSVMSELLLELSTSRIFPRHPTTLMGVGFGSLAALLYRSSHLTEELHSLVLVNPFSHLDPQLHLLVQNWMNALEVSQAMRRDLHSYLFSHLLFSAAYLSRVSSEQAFNALNAILNPISLAGRLALCRGMQASADVRPLLRKVLRATRTLIVKSSDDAVVGPSHLQPFIEAGEETPSLQALFKSARGNGVHVKTVEAGHMVFQEKRQAMHALFTSICLNTLEHADTDIV
eukprot:Rmarinus@m.25503